MNEYKTRDGQLDWEELRELMDRCLNGNQSDNDLQRLESLLLGNPTAQDNYLDACQLHSLINLNNSASRVVEQVRLKVSSKVLMQVKDNSSRDFPPKSVWMRSHRWLATIAAVAVAAAVLLATGLWLWTSDQRGIPNTADLSTSQSDIEQFIFNFGPGNEVLQLGEFGSAILEGPGQAEWISPKRIRLHSGRIRVRIDQSEGLGFTVDTPGTSVVDLGTEFAVDVSEDKISTVVVFEGAVEINYTGANDNGMLTERLVGGEAALVSAFGGLQRLKTIVTGRNSTFMQLTEYVGQFPVPLILNVEDNLIGQENKRFYEIVPGGMREDAKAYADRPSHEWNGLDQSGLPIYLVGIDYIKTYNGDKRRRLLSIYVTLSRAADIYVFFDARLPPPPWLTYDFRDTGDRIGLDMGQWRASDGKLIIKEESAEGPGQSIDAEFSVWVRRIEQAGVVRLGPSAGPTGLSAMYGIAVAEIELD